MPLLDKSRGSTDPAVALSLLLWLELRIGLCVSSWGFHDLKCGQRGRDPLRLWQAIWSSNLPSGHAKPWRTPWDRTHKEHVCTKVIDLDILWFLPDTNLICLFGWPAKFETFEGFLSKDWWNETMQTKSCEDSMLRKNTPWLWSHYWNRKDRSQLYEILHLIFRAQWPVTVAPFASLLGSILGQPVGIDGWSGLSELADQIMGFGENTSLKQICFFLHISIRGKWFWIDETEPGALTLEGMLHMWKPQQQQSRLWTWTVPTPAWKIPLSKSRKRSGKALFVFSW